MINFARGTPPAQAFPIEQLQTCARAVLEQDGPVVLQYHPAAGFVPLREWLAQRNGTAMDCVLISNGSLQILEFLSRGLASPGDTVLVESPTYDRAITLFRRSGLQVTGIPLQSDGYDVAALENLLADEQPRFFYLIPDFQNPTGATTSLAKRKRLVELAERHRFWLVEDNPYKDLCYRGESLPTLLSLGSDRVLHMSSFSKILSPGMRVGYIVGPEAIVGQLAKLAEDTYITPNMLAQGIVFSYCDRGWLEPNIERLKELYRPRMEALEKALAEHLPEAEWTSPGGGFFVGVNLPSQVDISILRTKAREQGLKLSDGRGFFPVGQDGNAFLRLPFCALSTPEIQQGIDRLSAIVATLSD